MKITVFTIAYNDYGVFIPRWLKCVQAQTHKPHEIIVVLGHEHGLINYISDTVKVIHHEQPATMGYLRNLAVDAATGDYLLYFSADDVLLENALQEISEVDADIIALRYYLRDDVHVTPEIVADKLDGWMTHYIGACGYVAFRSGLRYEDTDWPNYPLLFQAYTKGYRFKETDKPGAVYMQRPGGHGQSPENQGQGISEIRKYLMQYGLIKNQ